MGEKITLRRAKFLKIMDLTFSYVHNSLENVEKVYLLFNLAKIQKRFERFRLKISNAYSCTVPLAIDESGINKDTLDKELEIIKAELKNSGKKPR